MFSFMLFLFFFAAAIIVTLAYNILTQERQFRKVQNENASLHIAVEALEKRVKLLEKDHGSAAPAGSFEADPLFCLREKVCASPFADRREEPQGLRIML